MPNRQPVSAKAVIMNNALSLHIADPVARLLPAAASSVRLIINADDFGLSHPVNDGIILAHRMGMVTSASLMPVGKAFDHAVCKLQETPSLDIGVHLTLVGEEPLIRKNTSLINGGNRLPKDIASFMIAYFKGAIKLSDVRIEISAQIEKVLDRGVSISHIDSHQHVHALPGLSDITQELAETYGVPFIRKPCEALEWYMFKDIRTIGRVAGDMALKLFWSMTINRRMHTNGHETPHFLGFFHGGKLDTGGLHHILSSTQPGCTYELMCHPGFAPNEPEYRNWKYQHEGELTALASPMLRDDLHSRGFCVCNFRDLLNPSHLFP